MQCCAKRAAVSGLVAPEHTVWLQYVVHWEAVAVRLIDSYLASHYIDPQVYYFTP